MSEPTISTPTSLSARVWSLDVSPDEKLVLLALAEVYPLDGSPFDMDAALIGERTGHSPRTMRRITKRLRDRGILKDSHQVHQKGRLSFVRYRADLEAVATKARGFVYLLEANGLYKIGKTDALKSRIKNIQRGLAPHGITAKLIHAVHCFDPEHLEQLLHNRYSERRVDGEWFRLGAEEVKAIEAITEF